MTLLLWILSAAGHETSASNAGITNSKVHFSDCKLLPKFAHFLSN
jgi:hypothetical protein